MATKTIREALTYVAKHPTPSCEPIDMPVWEHIARALFDVANNPSPKVRGSMAKASRAQNILLERMVGRRRAGSRPINGQVAEVTFRDLTQPTQIGPSGE